MSHNLLVKLTKSNFEKVVGKSNEDTIKTNKRVSYGAAINKILTQYFEQKEGKNND